MKDILTIANMLLVYPFVLMKELLLQKFDFFNPATGPVRVINGALLLFGGVGMVLYILLGVIIYSCLN